MAHKTISYNRSPILYWWELTIEQKQEIIPDYENPLDNEEDCQYVIFKWKDEDQVLSLAMFEAYGSVWRPEKNPIWTGIYPTSYSDAFFIKINHTGEEALVCRRYFI